MITLQIAERLFTGNGASRKEQYRNFRNQYTEVDNEEVVNK